jgi:hypothetical protein
MHMNWNLMTLLAVDVQRHARLNADVRDLCKTDHWTTWTTSGGEVDFVEWRYE